MIGWTPRKLYEAQQTPNTGDGTATLPSGITVFQAVEEELGLKLVKQERSIPVIVVDHVDEKPVE